MRKIKMSLTYEERSNYNFKIEENEFLHSALCADGQSKFIKDLIENELNKPFNFIKKNDSEKIANTVFNLSVIERLHAVMGLLENYPLSKDDEVTKTVEGVLADKRFNQYRTLILSIVTLDDNEFTEKEKQSKKEFIENFEKENNIEILVEE